MQGTEDNFYKQGQLLPENFEKVAEEIGASDLQVNYREVRPIVKRHPRNDANGCRATTILTSSYPHSQAITSSMLPRPWDSFDYII